MIHGEAVMADLVIIAVLGIVCIGGFFFGLGQILKTKSAEEFLSDLSDWLKSIPDGRLFLPIIGLIVFIAFLYGYFE
jgi:hypothetical protein